MIPRFAFPWMLALLVLVPWSVWLGARLRSLSGFRKWAALTLRAAILILLVGALAGAEMVRTEDRLAVFFVMDRSNSVLPEKREAATALVREWCEKGAKTEKNEAGMIVVGEEASIETTVMPAFVPSDEIQSWVGGDQTDLASGVRLATAAFPQGTMKRIVAVTDGNETRGSVLEEVRLAAAAGVGVDVLPIRISGGQEVRLRELVSPGRVGTDEPFRLRAVVSAEQDTEGVLRVYRRGREGRRLLGERTVTLQKGDNSFLLTQELGTPGFYEYEASIEAPDDTLSANNEARAFSVVRGEPRVLLVDRRPEEDRRLADALRGEGLNLDVANLGEIPGDLAEFQNYDAVVFSDVAATDLSSQQMRAMEAMVRDLGIGLVMIGGPNAFGAGGFQDTPVERALPLSMDLKQRKVLPRGALVLVLHTCEIPDGNAWALQIGLASLEVLSSQDLMAASAYTYTNGDQWIYRLNPVGDKTLMRRALKQAAPNIGDMPAMGPSVQMGYQALLNADAAVKRMVLISDGDPAMPTRALLDQCAKAGISISTVCIHPHSPSDQNSLRAVAEVTGGNYYYVTDPQNLPQIFTKEAAVVRRGVLIEEEFVPQPLHGSELLAEIEALPPLKGYVATTAKETATVALISDDEDPVLAHWRYGLGKAVAFTSDAKSRWASAWIGWDQFARFWARAVRWSVRQIDEGDFRVDVSQQDGRGHIRIDAVDASGGWVNFLEPKAVVTGPEPDYARQDVEILQTAPGVYEGWFSLEQRGVYMVNVSVVGPDGVTRIVPRGLASGYSREYEYNTTNLPLLEQIAETGGGRILTAEDDPFRHDLTPTPTVRPIWQALALTAAILFPLEIFFRRVMFDLRPFFAFLLGILRRLPGLKRLKPAPAQTAATGAYYAAGARENEDGGERPAAFGERATEATTPRPKAPKRPAKADGAPTEETPPKGSTEYTSALLQAKRRAVKSRKPREEDEQNPPKGQ